MRFMHNSNWDDLRHVLAVIDAGTVSGAARKLRVNHATVLRRISAFEDHHGFTLFEKGPQGYKVPADRQKLVSAIREVEASMASVDRIVKGTIAPLSGVMRVTSTDTFCQAILPPILAQLTGQAEGLSLELICSNTPLDMSRMMADIAVRPTINLSPDLFGVRAGALGFDLYSQDGQTKKWLGLIGQLGRSVAAEWMALNVAPDQIAGSSDSFLVLRELAAAGQGQVILPCVLGDRDPRLQRMPGIVPRMEVPIWVASHIDLAQGPRLRRLREDLADALWQENDALVGA